MGHKVAAAVQHDSPAVDDREDDKTSEASSAAAQPVKQFDLTEQVLADFYSKPQQEVEVIAQQPSGETVWPCFPLRKILGLAHVSLHDAVLDGDVEGVRTAVQRYSRRCPDRLNEYDAQGRTALSVAIKTAREDVADQLIGMPYVDVGKPDSLTGLTPLHHAVQLDLPRTVDRLCKADAPIDAADRVGMTALMLACRLGNALIVEVLIDDADAQFEMADSAGWTCLFYATYMDHGELVSSHLAGIECYALVPLQQ
jgi:Ankyrin repeats (3 copies)